MRAKFVFFVLAFICLTCNFIEAKTTFRRRDKISEHFKQLSPDEIDPNVAPEPTKVDDDVTGTLDSGTTAPEAVDEVIQEVEDAGSEALNEVVDESANEVGDTAAAAAVAEPVATPVAAAPAAASTSSASSATVVTADESPLSKYCKCTDSSCDCCRKFNLPLIPVRGPGCAKITYLGEDKMSVSIKYGDITLASRTISGKKARPICVGLPGGYSKFCGRVYGLSRAKDNFKACLGFELRAEDEVEAALRVSCFKFGPEGLRVAEPEPLPTPVKDPEEDDDDIFGFAAGGDDEEEDDEYDAEDEEDDEDEPDEPEEEENDDDDDVEIPEEADYGGFSLGGLLAGLDDDEDEIAAKPTAATPVATSVAGQTRTVMRKAAAQSKDDKGTEADSADEIAGVENAAAATPVAAESATTIKKTKKSKKTGKKNKKKKAASAPENELAYEILNGILDFFN